MPTKSLQNPAKVPTPESAKAAMKHHSAASSVHVKVALEDPLLKRVGLRRLGPRRWSGGGRGAVTGRRRHVGDGLMSVMVAVLMLLLRARGRTTHESGCPASPGAGRRACSGGAARGASGSRDTLGSRPKLLGPVEALVFFEQRE